jgi:hypothetical protein
MAKIIRLTERDLHSIIKNVIRENNEATIDKYKKIFIDTGKIDGEYWDEIVQATMGKDAYMKWLCSRIVRKIIKAEDSLRYESLFKTFEQIKKSNKITQQYLHIPQFKTGEEDGEPKYTFNLDSIKTQSDIKTLEKAIDAFKQKDLDLSMDDNIGNSANLVSKPDLMKLDAAGIKLLGLVDGYQIFKISDISKETHKVYCDILFKAQKGAEIKFCTFGHGHYSRYLKDYPGSAYYFIFNLGDPMAPYQFHYESNQFMDRRDQQIF